MSDASDLDDLCAGAWSCMEAAARERDGSARLVTLATTGPEGPEARTLILRDVDRAADAVTLWTNLLSGKVEQLRADPRAALLFWDGGTQVQVRLRTIVTIASGQEDAWHALPPQGRANYATDPAPGTCLLSPDEAAMPDVSEEVFSRLICHVREMEVLTLATTPHQRAVFSPGRAVWLAP